MEATREAIAEERLGFADLYLVKPIDPAVARRQMENDHDRPRDRFELHLRLQEPLIAWYEALERVLPGRIRWELPADFSIPRVEPNPARYDVNLFDALVQSLPR